MKSTMRVLLLLASLAAPAAFPEGPQDPRQVVTAQKEAMAALKYMDGVWRGPATTFRPDGEKRTLTRTERIGAFVDGTLKVIEARSFDDSGAPASSALGIVSYDPSKKAYSLRMYVPGYTGDLPVTLKDDGFTCELVQPAGKIVYTVTVRGNVFEEVADRIVAGSGPARFFEMKLERVGDMGAKP